MRARAPGLPTVWATMPPEAEPGVTEAAVVAVAAGAAAPARTEGEEALALTAAGTAEAAVAQMCSRLLANPVMETADWELSADEAASVAIHR